LDAAQALHVKDYVPQCLSGTVERRMTDAYHASSALEAEAALLALAKELDRTHPGAAASLREGLDSRCSYIPATGMSGLSWCSQGMKGALRK